MNLGAFVPFEPEDIKAVIANTATRRQVMAVVTSQTCGEACWHAREEICRCSCGGRNHGCLSHGGERPERTAKIDGERYRLVGVGKYDDLLATAREINRMAGYRSVGKPCMIIESQAAQWTPEEIAQAKADGKRIWWSQYRYTWRETDSGAPARLKSATDSQRQWTELAGWKDERSVWLLWQRVTMPERPKQLVVDKETGEPLADQNPKCAQ